MYDQSFSPIALGRMLRRSDLRKYPLLATEPYRTTQLTTASTLAGSIFGGGNPLTSFQKNGKTIFRIADLPTELVARKITRNIKRLTSTRMPDRQAIVGRLKILISEGTPFRIYRLDIKSFYESFATEDVISAVQHVEGLNPQTKRLAESILRHVISFGATGVPRGLAVSSVLSELMMRAFDEKIVGSPGVYFYGRYVDDIIVVTGASEKKGALLSLLRRNLPAGLLLNESKQRIASADNRVSPQKLGVPLLNFNYLGYQFNVNEPVKINQLNSGNYFRDVAIDISRNKKRRYKTRICRAFADFAATRDFDLLYDRIKFLTHNFSIRDFNTGTKRLAGIYYNYPHITTPAASGLKELDKFLHDAARSRYGRVFSRSGPLLTNRDVRMLLTLSFVRGHQKRSFIHFHPQRIKAIQECWAHD